MEMHGEPGYMRMSDTSIYIHIGYPKTATTWLQRCVFPCLSGINYLHFQDQRYDWFNDLLLEHDLVFDADRLRSRFDASVATVATNPNLISWETFAGDVFNGGCNASMLAQRLFDVFPEAAVIITVRNQLDMIEALYRQYIHEGGTLSIGDFLSLRYPSPLRLAKEHFFYDRLVERYQQLFGEGRVKVLAYEQLVSDRPGFLSSLCDILGVDEDLAAIEQRCAKRVNVGMSIPSIYLARWLNRLVYSHFNPTALFPRKLLSARHVRFALQRVADPLVFNHLGGGKLLGEQLRTQWADYFRESNRKLMALSGLALDSYLYPM
jgi:hypothetical protein